MCLRADDDGQVAPARLKKRPDFLRAGAGRKAHSALFTVQVALREPDSRPSPRVGFTVTKKVGSSVERNRIKRRLREVVRTTRDLCMRPSHDYVIVARRDLLTVPFTRITAGLQAAVRKLHATPGSKKGQGSPSKHRTDVPTGG